MDNLFCYSIQSYEYFWHNSFGFTFYFCLFYEEKSKNLVQNVNYFFKIIRFVHIRRGHSILRLFLGENAYTFLKRYKNI